MSKFTPGPWEIEDDRVPGAKLPWRSTGLIWQKDSDSYQKLICRINPDKLHAGSPTSEIEAFEANARLIAAAPELLECAKQAKALLVVLSPIFEQIDKATETTEYFIGMKQIIGTLRLVIQQAGGANE